MRVVAGVARGRRLQAPRGLATRPTSDRVREALFSMLTSMGAFEGDGPVEVVDLFAGAGALGIEALSRGAGHATFVDDDGAAVAAIDANLTATGFAPRATVVRSDVLRWLASAGSYDLAFADPPYSFEHWDRLLERLDASLAVFESDRVVEVGPDWQVLKNKRYSGTVVTIARKA